MCIRDRHIAVANGYTSSMVDNLLKKHKRRLSKPRMIKNNEQTFISTAYTSIMPKILSKVLNSNNRTVTFKTSNNLFNKLRNRTSTPLEMKTGVYKLSCYDCECFYIGQTGRSLYKRFVEHTPKPVSYTHLLMYIGEC